MAKSSFSRLSGILLAFVVILLVHSPAYALPHDNEWGACDASEECTSIKVGCWYWAPVNKKYMEDRKAASSIACKESVQAGPQPTPSCQAHLCVNDPYTVAFWPKLIGAPQQNDAVTKRVKTCLDASGMEPPAARGDGTPGNFMVFPYADMINFFYEKTDKLIRANHYSADLPLDSVVESVITCDEVVAKAKSLKQ